MPNGVRASITPSRCFRVFPFRTDGVRFALANTSDGKVDHICQCPQLPLQTAEKGPGEATSTLPPGSCLEVL